MTHGNRRSGMRQAMLLAAVLIAARGAVSPALAGEILYAPFDQPSGVATAGLYSGDVWLTVSGWGQALGNTDSDAFYVRFENGGVTTPTQTGFWDLAVDTAPINGSGSQEAANRIVGSIPSYNPAGIYSFEVDAGSTPSHLHFGVDDQIYSDNAGAYTIVVGAAPTEVLYAPFAEAGGVETSGSYHGKILVTVSGVGQALGDIDSDAFYLLPGPNNAAASPTRPGFWDLAFGTSPILGDGSQEATNALVGALPAYSSDSIYTFELDTGSLDPTHLYFGVDDDILSDNAGAYTIAITQLGAAVPEPSTWALALVGFAGLAAAGLRRRRSMRVCAAVALLGSLGFGGSAQAATLYRSSVSLIEDIPEEVFVETQIVGPGVEFDTSVVGFSFETDVTSDQIVFQTFNGFYFNRGSFDGFVLDFSDAPAFVNVTRDASSFFPSVPISFTSDSVSFNLAGQLIVPEYKLVLDVAFASSPPAPNAPEPATWALALTGFIGLSLAGARERRQGRIQCEGCTEARDFARSSPWRS